MRSMLAREYHKKESYLVEGASDWEIEVQCGIVAAKYEIYLSDLERSFLIRDAMNCAEEYGYVLILDDYMCTILFDRVYHEEELIVQDGRKQSVFGWYYLSFS